MKKDKREKALVKLKNLFSEPFYSKVFAVILICFLGIIAYSNTFHSLFHYDDRANIVTNTAIRNLSNLKVIWNFWPTRFITFVSFAFNYYLNGLNVFGYHAVNFVIHLAIALLIFWFVNITFRTPAMIKINISRSAPAIALFSALIFLCHPIQTGSVTYIYQRSTCLAAFFYLLSLCLYIKSRLTIEEKKKGFKWLSLYILTWVTCIIAMFTKENTITLPLMIILYEFCFFERKKWSHVLSFLALLPIIPVTLYFSKTTDFGSLAKLVGNPITGWHYFLTQLRVIVTYLRLVFLPINQNFDYDYRISQSLIEPSVIMSLFILLLILFTAVRFFQRYKLLSFSIFWFFLTLLPEASFVPLDDVILEHRLYLPMVGFSLVLSSGAFYILAEKKIKLIMLILPVIIACLAILTYNRNFIWKNELSLWNDVIRKSPYKARAYNERGVVYTEEGDFARAISDLNIAIQLNPKYAYAYVNRGNVYGAQGKLVNAESDYLKAIEVDPNYAGSYYNLGNIYGFKGHFDEAIKNYDLALKLNPRFAEAYNNRAHYYFLKKEYAKALKDIKRAQGFGYNVKSTFLDALNNAITKENKI